MSKIHIENMSFKAYHGVYPEENKVGTIFIVDVVLDVDISQAAKSDALEDTYDYAIVFEICKKEMDIVSKLIEHVAGRIQKNMAQTFKLKKKQIQVTITKTNAPIKGFKGLVKVQL